MDTKQRAGTISPVEGIIRGSTLIENKSPKINTSAWGHIEVDGYDAPFKDVKLFPGGARSWDWNETGTRHKPGIQPADIEELLEKGAQTIILSKGVLLMLHTMPETFRLLEEKNVKTIHLQTDQAIKKYNELCQTEEVGALIHSTC